MVCHFSRATIWKKIWNRDSCDISNNTDGCDSRKEQTYHQELATVCIHSRRYAIGIRQDLVGYDCACQPLFFNQRY